MRTTSRRVVTLVLLAAVAALGSAARAADAPTPYEVRAKLIPLYHAVRADSRLLKLDAALAPRLAEPVSVGAAAPLDELLKQLPLSPLAYLEIDMQLRRYEVAVPRFIAEAHVRWIELNEKTARAQYGDRYVDEKLGRRPLDARTEVLGPAAAAVGTNRNVAATSSPVPLDYQGEIQVVVNPANPNQVVAAANTWHAAGAACNNQETQAIFYSSDAGTSWGYTCAPSANAYGLGSCSGVVFGSDPALAWDDAGSVYLNYMLLCSTTLTDRFAMVVARSTDGGATWAARGVIKNSWGTTDLEDKNFYTIDTTPTSPFYGRHYTCWDRNNNEKIAYSTNAGTSWTEVDLPIAASGTYDLGCEIAVAADGSVHVVFDTLNCGTTCSNERMFYTRSTNGGGSWSTPTLVRDFNLVSFSSAAAPPVADSRGINPFGSIDADNSGGPCHGTLYATYSDYVSGSVADNDVWVVRSTNGGGSWSSAVKVNDDGLAGRIQFHPFLTVDQTNGGVVVGWHDARGDSGNKRVDYYVARSTNCGVSFEANVKASSISSEFNNSGISYTDENTADNPSRNPNQYGEYMGVAAHGGKAYLAWTDSRHFYPGSSSETQKENVGFALVDFGGGGGGPVCGNGIVETGESCDGENLNGQTCVSLGFSGGTLACSGSCSFDTSGCTTGSTTTSFVSVAAQDGRVLESSETSGVGGTVNSSASTSSAIRVGDDNSDRQYRGLVSFDTSSIPDAASVLSVTLRLRRGTVSGTNPFTTHGAMSADVSSAFGGSTTLASGDFQAAASATAVCTLSNAAANLAWSECTFNAAGLAAVNKTGATQVRVQFASDDNDDRGTDYIGYYSGNNATAGNRPQLVVTYQ